MPTIELPKRYRVARHIASGGMASVWEAQDLLLRRTVAVKVLGAHFDLDSGARERFQREARTSAQLSDRHIVTIYDIGEHREHAFIVMEYFAGGTVADRLRAARDGGAGVPRTTALRWLREAADGLDVAHAAGIVHRDVKPANLMLDAHDRLAVGDFGIARLADDTQMTQTGQVLGTAAYLSPEQALGRPATAASDRYALAVVAYELLTGARPFAAGPPAAQARQHVEAPPPHASQAAPDLPGAVDAVLARGLAKEPSQRPPSATALVDELERALNAGAPSVVEPTRALPAVTPTEPTRKARPGPPAHEAPSPRRVPPPPRATPAPPAPSLPKATPTAPARGRKGGARRFAPLALLAFAALSIGGIAALAAGGDDDPSKDGSARPATQAGEGTKTSTKKSSPPPASEQPATPAPAASGESPSTLDARGYGLIKQGQEAAAQGREAEAKALYAEAVPIEQQAVAGFEARNQTSGSGYAFALFNLGTALNRSGRPSEAIPYLEKRLSISNDRRSIVRKELVAARAAAGGSPPAGKKKSKQQDGDNNEE